MTTSHTRVLNRRKSKIRKARKSGFRSRMSTTGGRRVLARQRRKKANRLGH